MSEPSIKIVPALSSPWTISLYIFRSWNDDPGYRCVGHKLLSVEESKPAITRDSEGLWVIDQDKITKMIESVMPLDLSYYTDEDWRDLKRTPIWSEEQMKTLGMKREILKEWKEYYDWHYSTWLPSHSSSSSRS